MADYASDDNKPHRLIGLVQYCQRVLVANIDAISSFGEDIPPRLIIPILQACPPDVLLRLEQETPCLQGQTSELWREHCLRSFPAFADVLQEISCEGQGEWCKLFYDLRKKEEQRFEEAANKIRSQRQEAEELKRKRQIKITDRPPVTKRARHGWDGPAPPKTLFQKTRKEASRFQKNVFGSPSVPPPPGPKGCRVKAMPRNEGLIPKEGAQAITVTTVRSVSKGPALASTSSKLKPPPFRRTTTLNQNTLFARTSPLRHQTGSQQQQSIPSSSKVWPRFD